MIDFMQSVAREGGFTYEVVEVGQDSKDLYTSSFTACVHAVAINQTDLCIGNFWVTTERLLIHPSFTSTVYEDEMLLLVQVTREQSFWDKVIRPFSETLTLSAWALVLCNMLFMSVVMAVIEGNSVGDGPDKILKQLKSAEASRAAFNVEVKTSLWRSVSHSIYYGFLGLTAGSPAHEADELPGALVLCGFAIFSMLFAASYTGSTAAVLIADTGARASIKGLMDIAAVPGAKLCLLEASRKRFLLRYPQVLAHLPSDFAATPRIILYCRQA